MRVPLFLMLAVIFASGAAAQVRSVHESKPRQFGYFVGDVLHTEVDVTVDPAYTLVEASVPQVSALNQWLDIVGSRIKEDSGGDAKLYKIFLDYQTFYPALDSRQLVVPAFELSFVSGTRRVIAKVPEWSFLISPLREVEPAAKESGADYMVRDAPPGLFMLARLKLAVLASSVVLLVLLALLAHQLAWWPFLMPKKRPFVRAARQVHKLLGTTQDAASYRASLQIVHRAIDETAGHAVLGDDVSTFLRDAPAFARLREDFISFFRSSRRVFFADTATAGSTFGARELRRFCDQLAAAERAAR